MNSETVTFKKSRIIQTSASIFVCGALVSVFPEVNADHFIINMILTAMATLLLIIIFLRNRDESKWYFSLHSYVMINSIAVFFAVPLFRLMQNNIVIITCIILLCIVVVLPYFFSESILRSVNRPNKSKLGKIYLAYAVIFITFGYLTFMHGLATSNTNGIALVIYLFAVSILLFFISPAFLFKPKKVDKVMQK